MKEEKETGGKSNVDTRSMIATTANWICSEDNKAIMQAVDELQKKGYIVYLRIKGNFEFPGIVDFFQVITLRVDQAVKQVFISVE